MKVMQAPDFIRAFDTLPGTPIVALNEKGEPTAIGVKVSADPAEREAELAQFTSKILDRSDRIGDVTTAISSVLDVAANQHPDWADGVGEAGAILAFVATGIGVAHAVDQQDARAIAISGFKFGANALDLLDKSGLLGNHPALHTAVLIAKASGSVLNVGIPKKIP